MKQIKPPTKKAFIQFFKTGRFGSRSCSNFYTLLYRVKFLSLLAIAILPFLLKALSVRLHFLPMNFNCLLISSLDTSFP